MFADDVKLYTEIKSQTDFQNFQLCLNKLENWAEIWQLKFSINKCCILDIGLCKMMNINIYDCFLDDTKLGKVQSCRDLGVTVDSKLSFSYHMIDIVTRAKQRMSLLLRTFISKDPSMLVLAFRTYVLPLLDYCCQVWSPHLIKDILLIESVQRIFTKRLIGLKDFSYTDRLKLLNIISLERRRLEFDLILCYKILHRIVSGTPEKYGLVLSNRKSRGHSLKLNTENAKIDVRKILILFCEQSL